jgi:heparanase 1
MRASFGVLAAIAVCAATFADALGASSTVKINTDAAAAQVSARFLSVTLDAGGFSRHWDNVVPFTDPRLIHLAQGLAPAFLRVSGTDADYLYYDVPGDTEALSSTETGAPGPHPVSVVNESTWNGLTGLAKTAGWDMIFGISMLNRTSNDQWRPQSAQALMEYAKQQGIIVGYELGNEPDLDNSHGKTNFTITPNTTAQDFAAITKLISEVYGQDGPPRVGDASPSNPLLAGCDVADEIGFLTGFAQELVKVSPNPSRALSTLTWHHYYGNGADMTVGDFVKPDVLDKVRGDILQAATLAQSMPGGNETEVWIGESGSSYDGGTPGVSDRFVSIFWWLDQLSYAALHGHGAVCRQAFIGGAYTMVDPQPALFPNSDYWAAVLYKRIMGGGQLSIPGQEEAGVALRTYAACTRRSGTADAQGVRGVRAYPPGSVTALLLNVQNVTSTVTFATADAGRGAGSAGDGFGSGTWDLFQLTAPNTNISSKAIQLNGDVLSLQAGGVLPPINPVQLPANQPVQLPPFSASFVVIEDAGAAACM